MARSKDVSGPSMTPNQVVAFNLREARKLRAWTQEEATEALVPFLGIKWSKATYSQAERSFFDSKRIRHFSADELHAFSRAFRVPVLWFFLPPPSAPEEEVPPIINLEQAAADGESSAALLGRMFDEAALDQLHERLKELYRALPDDELLPHQKQLARLSTETYLTLLERELGDVSHWAEVVGELGKVLQILEVITPNQIVEQMLLDTSEKLRRWPDAMPEDRE